MKIESIFINNATKTITLYRKTRSGKPKSFSTFYTSTENKLMVLRMIFKHDVLKIKKPLY